MPITRFIVMRAAQGSVVLLGVSVIVFFSLFLTGDPASLMLPQDYVRTARAKGLSEWRVIIRHALRNALIPVVTVQGMYFAALLGGALITELIFAWPGIGRLAVQRRCTV